MKTAIEQHTALLVIGTGFSAASVTDSRNCSWPELLRSGIEYISSNIPATSNRITDSILNDIEIGVEEDDAEFLLTAAQKITNSMGGTSSQHFSSFLKSTLGILKPDSSKTSLALALQSLNLPMITTNYDTVFEDITGRKSVCWSDVRRSRSALVSTDNDSILHLHGIWNEPESIIITSTDYEKVVNDKNLEALRSSVGLLRTMIFVGFGSGLHDPHLTSLWRWLSDLSTGATHYALCRSGDLAYANSQDGGTPIISVPYGETYTDLTPFVKSLASKKISIVLEKIEDPHTFNRVTQVCRTVLIDRLKDSSAISRKTREEEIQLDDLVVEPILLPVPPEQFSEEKDNEDSDIEVLKPIDEIRQNKILTIVGEEQSGITTTLIWMILKRSEFDGHMPVLIDYSKLSGGNKSVAKSIRKTLRGASAPLSDAQPIPFHRLCVAIDNVNAAINDKLAKIISELSDLEIPFLLLGCRPGVELRIQRDHSSYKSNPKPIYLGQFGITQAKELAQKIDPQQAQPIAARVLSITRKERLSRTPLAIILLISGVANDDGWINTVSNTSFIDAFVDSLLGRGNLRDDMHSQIDSAGYSRVLESIAMKIIEDDSASIDLTSLIVYISELVKSLDWSDSPDIVIRDLITKGLLVNRGTVVRFRQNVYMHIFAARAAVKDREILTKLIARPLYYGAIIRHYAALKRDDEKLVQWAFDQIKPADKNESPMSGLFGLIDPEETNRREKSIEILAERLSLTIDAESGEDCIEDPSEADEKAVIEDIDLQVPIENTFKNFPASNEPLYDPQIFQNDSPFPSSNLEDAPLDMKLAGTITLVSNILRDSELVENPSLKEDLLKSTLSVWGHYIDIINGSPQLRSMIEGIVRVIGDRLEINPERRDIVTNNLVDSWSMYEAYRGIEEELSTIKLRKALERIAENEENMGLMHIMLPAYMLDGMHDAKYWHGRFDSVLLENKNIQAVQIFVRVFVKSSYIASAQNSGLHRSLERFLTNFYMSQAPLKISKKARGRLETRYRQQLRDSWAKARAVESVRQRALEVSR